MRRHLVGKTIAVAAALYLLAATAIAIDGASDRVFVADTIIVLGNTIEADGQPSPRLQARLDKALELFRLGKAPRILVSGGFGKEGFDEATVMATYLEKNGVPPSAIVTDSQGLNTAATAVNAGNYMHSHNLHSAIVVSQYFHISRIKLALHRAGITQIGSAHARFLELRDIYSLAREVAAYTVYYMKR